MNKDTILSIVTADNDQDREAAKQWMRQATLRDRFLVWTRIQQEYTDPVDEIVSRFAQLAFGEIMAEVEAGKEATDGAH